MASPTKKHYRDEGRPGLLADENIGPLGVIFCFLLIAGAVAILDYGVLPPVYKEGMRPPANIYSRLEFRYNDPNELNRLREDAAEKAPRVYVENPAWVDDVLRDLNELFKIVEVSQRLQDGKDRAARYPADAALVEELFKYNQEMGERRKFLSTVLLGRIRSSLQAIADFGIITSGDLDLERNKRGEHREINRVLPANAASRDSRKQNSRIKVEWLRSVEMASDELMRATWKDSLPRDLERQLYAHLITRLSPNLTVDVTQTDQRREDAQELIGRGLVQVKQGELILNKDRKILKADLDKLHEEYKAYKQNQTLDTVVLGWKIPIPTMARFQHLLGLSSVVFAALLIFLFFTARSEPDILQRRRALVMLGLFILAALATGRGLVLNNFSAALTPFVFIGIVASLAFGQTIALLSLFGLCVLTTLSSIRWEAFPVEGGIPALALALMAGGVAASIPSLRLRDRWDLLRYGAIGGVVQGILVAGIAWLGSGLAGSVAEDALAGVSSGGAIIWRAGIPSLPDSLLALLNGPLCGLLVLGSLPLIEMLFGILTNIRLFELADLNRPALRRILEEAPGTFQHTLQVRFLAEPASDAVGANTRLISAGVLYHDIGKILKPEYFVENQMDAPERHRRLRPSVSALLITAHVKDGIELAHEYGLPQQIIDFIPEHHGTTLVSYFYHSAKKKAESENEVNGGGSESVQESFFRYPGPKPQSRETAIVMLADTLEAATRTLENPSAARLKAFVHELIMDKMLDNQLDESNLTFAELALIEEAFLRVLVTKFHSRVRYPGQEEEAEKPEFDGKKTTIMETPDAIKNASDRQRAKDAQPSPEGRPSSRREVLTETRFIGRGSERKDPEHKKFE